MLQRTTGIERGEMEGMPQNVPRMVKVVFNDYKGRRAGLIKALTTDFERFYQLCDPEKENLCLFGYPNETWDVNLPAEEVPADIPGPLLGINFARDGMQEKDWLSLVAVHSDSWLLGVAFYFGNHFGFGKNEREEPCNLIDELPTVFEVLKDNAEGLRNHQSGNHIGSSKSKSGSKVAEARHPDHLPKGPKMAVPNDEDSGGEDFGEDEQDGTLCGACGENYGSDGFWICCDICEKWYHGNCVKITPAKAEHIKRYKCPGCSNRRAR